jgi:hypothetical protein
MALRLIFLNHDASLLSESSGEVSICSGPKFVTHYLRIPGFSANGRAWRSGASRCRQGAAPRRGTVGSEDRRLRIEDGPERHSPLRILFILFILSILAPRPVLIQPWQGWGKFGGLGPGVAATRQRWAG